MALPYRITVKGALDDDWSDWFDGLTITHDAAGAMLRGGAVRDQTALYGRIAKAGDLGVTLVAVKQRTTALERDTTAPPRRTTAAATDRRHRGRPTTER